MNSDFTLHTFEAHLPDLVAAQTDWNLAWQAMRSQSHMALPEGLGELALIQQSLRRESNLKALLPLWHSLEAELQQLGKTETSWNVATELEAAQAQLNQIQSRLLLLKPELESFLSAFPHPDRLDSLALYKKFQQISALFWDSLKLNNESAFLLSQKHLQGFEAEMQASEALSFSEKIALAAYLKAFVAACEAYFVLRKFVAQALHRLKTGHGVRSLELRELVRFFQKSELPEAMPEPPEYAWGITFLQNAEETVLQNSLGLPLPQINRSYQEYLKTGFYWLEQSAHEAFQNPHNLILSAEAFYKALSVNAYSFESLWALACILFLLNQNELALDFLVRAVKENQDPGLKGLQEVLDLYSLSS
ncbi:hypothetical protein COW36_20170 [bacterium (Candidatus Blackallbacteria) CG17_big_fil_post_rev_8_21_14_2_50_48_46]|uniref:Uncharacterized protein n=1 Tax=bacterium (Candidatus Blackallbacteria) CG17_big_fil_post_rev_8_21_14_2_50_48_46 TaxID=2014261 RepID=A0A2M7FZ98_9BACT|nr:MAG: hypothetical protein COW64_22495 [bacterium (Candidatus Blackallbacteria) CG18_big_fil_WC_8_21_14_2_50_49_26]PIW14724.1 MAG: hypothetical protein COW36_20170 [bacterium (Candidatus Blackallbacteria) CG17_big_fil_post_rev_8_21_14_2_50_48_46]PIW50826.1 MAG: hypothetical protein COW20_00985 [bacterium (Candidatus Blackallbacteria) CG13_big_fil_rev_8_21_14_2_50_49_14]